MDYDDVRLFVIDPEYRDFMFGIKALLEEKTGEEWVFYPPLPTFPAIKLKSGIHGFPTVAMTKRGLECFTKQDSTDFWVSITDPRFIPEVFADRVAEMVKDGA